MIAASRNHYSCKTHACVHLHAMFQQHSSSIESCRVMKCVILSVCTPCAVQTQAKCSLTEYTHICLSARYTSHEQFNPLRAGFKRAEGDPNGCDTYARDCLNLGVKPDMLIQKARARFESAGGTVLENTSITGITVRPNGAEISVASDSPLTARLVLDCMGNGSPLVRQMRWGRKPEGICSYRDTHNSCM
jgi:hypothetical protein